MAEEIPRLEALFIWFEETAVGVAVRDSVWAFAVIEAIHLLGLCLLGGALLIVDLRLLGLGLTHQPVAQIARRARGWLVLGVCVMLATGIPLMLSEAIKTYYNTAFWVKISTLPVALLFTFLVRERLARKESAERSPHAKLVALLSIALWFTVAAGGRWIGFS
jgi:hypothetical protein